MAVPFTDYQQGYLDGVNKARDVTLEVSNKYDSGGMFNDLVTSVLVDVYKLLEDVTLKMIAEVEPPSAPLPKSSRRLHP